MVNFWRTFIVYAQLGLWSSATSFIDRHRNGLGYRRLSIVDDFFNGKRTDPDGISQVSTNS